MSARTPEEAALKRFLVLWNSSVPASEQMARATPEQVKAGMGACMAWVQSAGDAAVDLGAPMQAPAMISFNGAAGNDSQATGYSLLQGNSRDNIDALLADHPHLKMPGSSTDVFEALPVPGMWRRRGAGGRSNRKESGRPDLNRRPPAPRAGALPGCATSRRRSSLSRSLDPF
jgi:hypothetical protein